jgi:hypothetical protein
VTARLTVARSRSEFLAARADLRGRVGVVLTMGALHDGHRALIETARAECDSVVATVFVNPLQFGPHEDLARYPRTAEADIALCDEAGADLLWMPAVEDVYAAGPVQVTVAPGPIAQLLEGASRPGHFDGVLTVVCKFLLLTRADAAYFGEKDYQQLTLVRRMASPAQAATGTWTSASARPRRRSRGPPPQAPAAAPGARMPSPTRPRPCSRPSRASTSTTSRSARRCSATHRPRGRRGFSWRPASGPRA